MEEKNLKREKKNTTKIHDIQQVEITNTHLLLKVDGKPYSFALADISKRLLNATDMERQAFRVSASGYGIHWPMLDEDLSINGLLGLRMQPPVTLEIA